MTGDGEKEEEYEGEGKRKGERWEGGNTEGKDRENEVKNEDSRKWQSLINPFMGKMFLGTKRPLQITFSVRPSDITVS